MNINTQNVPTAPETQETIVQWANEMFGGTASALRLVARAHEEMAELITAAASGRPPDEILEEAADVMILLYRVAHCEGQALKPISSAGWLSSQMLEIISAANHSLADVLSALVKKTLTLYPLHRTWFLLGQVFWCRGENPQHWIDAKMAINRTRVWKKDSNGNYVRDKVSA